MRCFRAFTLVHGARRTQVTSSSPRDATVTPWSCPTQAGCAGSAMSPIGACGVGKVTASGQPPPARQPHWRLAPRRRYPPTCTACRRCANNTSIRHRAWKQRPICATSGDRLRNNSIQRSSGLMLDGLSPLVKNILQDKLRAVARRDVHGVKRSSLRHEVHAGFVEQALARRLARRRPRPRPGRRRQALFGAQAQTSYQTRHWARNSPGSPTRWSKTIRSSGSRCIPDPASRRTFRGCWIR